MTKNQPRATTSEDRRSEDAKSMVRVKDCERKARRKAEMTSEELEEEKILRALKKAEDTCLITNSLNATVTLDVDITRQSH